MLFRSVSQSRYRHVRVVWGVALLDDSTCDILLERFQVYDVEPYVVPYPTLGEMLVLYKRHINPRLRIKLVLACYSS